MRRKILEYLQSWQARTTGRLPLLIHGARQVGKTYSLKEFGASCFQNYVYINFEQDDAIGAYFSGQLKPARLIKIIEELYNVEILPQKTLLIFDEIQASERALTALKYFAEEANEYCVIGAGSLLGVAINREQVSFPVGKVQMVTMYPLDFEEFLWAKGKSLLAATIREHFQTDRALPEALHQEGLLEYKDFLVTGGMPAVVAEHVSQTTSSLLQDELKQLIYSSYVADMAKYTDKSQSVKISEAYHSLPAQLAKDNKKFQYKLIKSGGRASLYGDSIDWLIQSGIVLKCTKCMQGAFPPAAYEDLSSFKLYFSDTGLFTVRTKITLSTLALAENFLGALTENYVAIALKANGYDLNYWASDSTAEVDFLIVKDDSVIPVECKANLNVKAKSLASFVKKYQPKYSIRISAKNFGLENNIKSVPLYAVFCI